MLIDKDERCKVCGSKDVVNKHFSLCEQCNYKRLHDGKTRQDKTRQEVYQERREGIRRLRTNRSDGEDRRGATFEDLKKTYSIKKISNKRAKVEEELRKIYKQIDLEREPVCEGCGRGDRPLSHSHIISRAVRPDLVTDKRNIRLHCFLEHGDCHHKWENFDPEHVVNMLDFEANLKYIAEVDQPLYKKIMMWLSKD